jgi:hypothetical protein
LSIEGTLNTTSNIITEGQLQAIGGGYFDSDVYIDGTLETTDTITAPTFNQKSDVRYKHILSYIDAFSLKYIANAPIFKYTWKEDNTVLLGTSAQYWRRKLPELVYGENELSLNYSVLGTIIGILNTRRILELEKKIKELESKINDRE